VVRNGEQSNHDAHFCNPLIHRRLDHSLTFGRPSRT
jgi:hypothetical protein